MKIMANLHRFLNILYLYDANVHYFTRIVLRTPWAHLNIYALTESHAYIIIPPTDW